MKFGCIKLHSPVVGGEAVDEGDLVAALVEPPMEKLKCVLMFSIKEFF